MSCFLINQVQNTNRIHQQIQWKLHCTIAEQHFLSKSDFKRAENAPLMHFWPSFISVWKTVSEMLHMINEQKWCCTTCGQTNKQRGKEIAKQQKHFEYAFFCETNSTPINTCADSIFVFECLIRREISLWTMSRNKESIYYSTAARPCTIRISDLRAMRGS